MQIAFAKEYDKSATTLLLCFSGFATSPRLLAHLACDIPACNIAICYDYADIHRLDFSLESTFLPPVLRDLQELIDRHRHCILVGFSLGVAVASGVLAMIDRVGAFAHSVAINGTPLGISAKYGIHPRIYAHTLEYFDVQEFGRAFFGSDKAENIARANAVKSPIMRDFNGDFSAIFGGVLECKQELLALQRFCQAWREYSSAGKSGKSGKSGVGVHFTHAIISRGDKIFPPNILESTFLHTPTQCRAIDAPHYVFGSFDSWSELLGLCVPNENSRARFWEVRQSYTENAPIQAAMRRELVELLLRHTGGREFARVFEFGAGVGDFSALLQANLDYTQFVCNDINNHASILQARLSAHTQVMTFDMHEIKNQPIFTQRFDLIASNACLQWLRAREVLIDVASMLADDGVLLLGSFGGKNCYEGLGSYLA